MKPIEASTFTVNKIDRNQIHIYLITLKFHYMFIPWEKMMKLRPEEIIQLLKLTPHPTCGLVKETYRSKIILPKNLLYSQFSSDRPAGSVLYFMLTQTIQIKLHKIRSDQMYHFYFGSPVEVFLFYPQGNFEVKVMGHDLKANMTPQVFIPADTFHTTKMHNCKNNSFSLLGTSEWIGVEAHDIQLCNPKELIRLNPYSQPELMRFFENNQSITQ